MKFLTFRNLRCRPAKMYPPNLWRGEREGGRERGERGREREREGRRDGGERREEGQEGSERGTRSVSKRGNY